MNRAKLIRLFILQAVQAANDAGETVNANSVFRIVQNGWVAAGQRNAPGIMEVQRVTEDLENTHRHLVSVAVEDEKEYSITPLGRTWVLQNGARG